MQLTTGDGFSSPSRDSKFVKWFMHHHIKKKCDNQIIEHAEHINEGKKPASCVRGEV